MDEHRPPEFEDMQALVRFGHGSLRDSRFLLLGVRDRAAAGRWLGALDVSDARVRSPVPERAVQIAFTAPGLAALGLPEDALAQLSDEFLVGMAGDESRSRRLGDVGESDPRHWDWGGTTEEAPHALLLLYARVGELDAHVDAMLDDGFRAAFDVLRTLPTDTLVPDEPFGFTDGISQPAIDWEGRQRTDTHAREGYSNLLASGEVVLGYPNEYGLLTRRPLLDPAVDPAARTLSTAVEAPALADLGANGSYLVLRQLEQDVAGFRRFVARAGNDGEGTPAELAAAMVGRERDGTPLVPPTGHAIAGVAPGDARNRFTYDDDPRGLRCPLGAHVRRANPRGGDFPPGVRGPFSRLVRALGLRPGDGEDDLVASARFHRLLRRGRAYGVSTAADASPTTETLGPDADDASALVAADAARPQGLQFVCLVGNILRQFEFVQNAWIDASGFAGTRGERDPLLGAREPRLDGSPTDAFRRPDPRGAARVSEALPRFVRVRGGAYFFLPGVAALRYLAVRARSGADEPGESDRSNVPGGHDGPGDRAARDADDAHAGSDRSDERDRNVPSAGHGERGRADERCGRRRRDERNRHSTSERAA